MRQRGVALITAVVMVALATVLATRIGTRAATDQRRTGGLIALDQGWEVALGAEAWAAETLRRDAERSSRDYQAEEWATPIPPLPIDGGSVEGAVEDMQGRFNVNNLIRPDGTVNEAAVQQFERLLIRIGVEPRWARIAADWLDTDTVPGVPEGAEDGVYLGQVPAYRAANGPITTTSELMALPGFGLDNYLRLKPYVAALPVSTRINVCTASAPVLESLIEGAADFGNQDALVRNRSEGCFPTLDDLKGTLGETQFQPLAAQLSETSSWFRAVTTVSIGTSQLTLYSLMERDASGVSRTVLRSIGTE